MSGIHRRTSHERRVLRDNDFLIFPPPERLFYDFLMNTGARIEDATVQGPDLTFTRASNAMVWNEAGRLQYAPHQLMENANLGTRTGDVPSGYGSAETADTVTWTDIGSGSNQYSQVVATGTTQRFVLTQVTSGLEGGAVYTFFAYIKNSAVTAGNTIILQGSQSGGTDGDITDADCDALVLLRAGRHGR